MDALTIQRIAMMHPDLREELLKDYTYANNKLLPKGVRLRFAHTYRTNAEQDALFAQKPKVTNAKGGQSIHQYGCAFDIVILFDKDGDGKFETASWAKDKHWIAVTDYFKSKEWVCGDSFKSLPDAPHFEKTLGHTWKTLKAKLDKGECITETINGLKYVYPTLE